jgi:hypothetical protein
MARRAFSVKLTRPVNFRVARHSEGASYQRPRADFVSGTHSLPISPTPPKSPMPLQRPVTSSMILPGACLAAAYSKASRARASGYTSAMIGLSFPSSTSVEI